MRRFIVAALVLALGVFMLLRIGRYAAVNIRLTRGLASQVLIYHCIAECAVWGDWEISFRTS